MEFMIRMWQKDFLKWVGQIKPEDIVKKYKKETADRIWGNTALRTGWLTRAHVGGRFGQRSRLVAAHFALY